MKRFFILTALAVLLGVASVAAQQIAVVTEGGETTVFQTLQAAIEGANSGSVIYLPGGGFPLPDSVKITKRLTIIGIGHKSNNDNVDGATTINGNLFFNQGSSGSAIMGCYITGNVNIGENDAIVNNMIIKYCNLNSVQVKNNTCQEIIVDQNYVRGDSNFGSSYNITISHNVIGKISNVGSGVIKNNVICHNNYNSYGYAGPDDSWSLHWVNNSLIANNVFRKGRGGAARIFRGSDCTTIENYLEQGSWGDDPIVIDANANDIFVNVNDWAVNPASNFHFKNEYKQYENQVGVYVGGVDFDNQTAPVPYIVAKRIAEQTDAAGQLKIQVRVKAGE